VVQSLQKCAVKGVPTPTGVPGAGK
jgi:hypothetical protein